MLLFNENHVGGLSYLTTSLVTKKQVIFYLLTSLHTLVLKTKSEKKIETFRSKDRAKAEK